ncbi:hypothetical protein QLS31_13335, partial [Flavobacterium sp. XS2P24]|nr:hypothetical protein [Flavobacterium sp. XS2P24]
MKSTKMVLGIAVIALGFTSCKDEKAEQAEKTVDTYVMYVDSLGNVASEDAKANWQGIEATYQLRSGDAQAALANMKDNAEAQERQAVKKPLFSNIIFKFHDTTIQIRPFKKPLFLGCKFTL